jgi:hypothetical protein
LRKPCEKKFRGTPAQRHQQAKANKAPDEEFFGDRPVLQDNIDEGQQTNITESVCNVCRHDYADCNGRAPPQKYNALDHLVSKIILSISKGV